MKNFLFKPTFFKEILRGLTIIPSFIVGWFITEIYKPEPRPSMTVCLIIITIGLLYISWAIAYIILKQKNQN